MARGGQVSLSVPAIPRILLKGENCYTKKTEKTCFIMREINLRHLRISTIIIYSEQRATSTGFLMAALMRLGR